MTEQEALAVLQGDDPVSAARAEATLWALWCQSGVPEVDDLLRDGVQAMERRDMDEAEACFARIGDIAERKPIDISNELPTCARLRSSEDCGLAFRE